MKDRLRRLIGTPAPLADEEPESREYVPPTAEDLRWYRRSIAGSAPDPVTVEKNTTCLICCNQTPYALCDTCAASFYPVPSVRSLRSWQEAR